MITYIGQAVIMLLTAQLTCDVLRGIATIPVHIAGGFCFALICIAAGNMDRNSIFYPSLLGAYCWIIILGSAA